MTTVTEDHPFYTPREPIYIQPRGRRVSEYESVICYSHVDLQTGYEAGDSWSFLGMDGREPVDTANTRLEHPKWYEYRDPSGLWQRPYIRHQDNQEHAIQAAMDGAVRQGAYQDIDPTWASEVLAPYYEGLAFLEWGISRAFASVVREARTDTLTMAYGFTAMDRLRHQQAIALYSLDLAEHLPHYKDGMGRDVWMGDPALQPARHIAEKLIACRDWAEVVVVTNLLVDPLLTNLMISKFFRRLAPLHGDVVTAVISMTAESDRARNRAGAVEFVTMVTAEADREGRVVPAAANRAVLQEWIDQWSPLVLEAVDAFVPVFGLAPCYAVDPDTARAEVVAECVELLAGLGLSLPIGGR